MNIQATAKEIATLLDQDNTEAARKTFLTFAEAHGADVGRLAVALGSARYVPPPGVIYVGPSRAVFSNPVRDGWSWRCGVHHPCAGVNYPHEHLAQSTAKEHAALTGATVVEVTS